VPDERDWVGLVAHDTCPECGLEASAVERNDLAGLIRGEGDAWADLLLTRPDEELRARPEPDRWSPLEYAAHVRGALSVFADRVARALAEDDPEFGWWDHEAAAVDERYNEQDPAVVAAGLRAAANRLADAVDAVPLGGWQRAGTRRGTERFTVEGIARYSLHEAHHHRHDAG
jgi:hypothetical protein